MKTYTTAAEISKFINSSTAVCSQTLLMHHRHLMHISRQTGRSTQFYNRWNIHEIQLIVLSPSTP